MLVLSYHTETFHKFCESCVLNSLSLIMVDACSNNAAVVVSTVDITE